MAKYAPIQLTSVKAKSGHDVHQLLQSLNTVIGGAALADFMAKEVYPYLRERALSRFGTGGDDASGKWPPLHEATQNFRAYEGYGATGPINVRTGELENYIRGVSPALVVSPDSVTMIYPGNLPDDPILSRKYRTAQAGSNQKPRTAPRPVIAMNSADWTFIYTALERHIMTRGLG